jgi:eukaryotic-like serine/threonine-protein kinase
MSLVGSKVGNILLEQRLGVGGMGEVYRGFDERLERAVAVKTIRADQRMSAEMKGRFLREARLLSRLGHPAICQVYDIVETDDADYLILEFIDGQTLRELTATGLRAALLLDLAEQTAAALEVAHGQKVVHRDLKPENIMVTAAGRVKVLDFGIARSLLDPLPSAPPPSRSGAVPLSASHATEGLSPALPRALQPTELSHSQNAVSAFATHYLTQAGSVIGTRYYMSPEQAEGGAVTEASDLYSFGVVLEDLLEAWRFSASEARTADEKSEVGELDPEVLMLISELKRKAPAERPTATQARERFRAIIEKPNRLKRRKLYRRLASAAGALLLGLLAVMSYLAWAAQSARTLAEQRTRQAESLISFVIGDLRKKLEPIGRLDLLDGVGERALQYYEQVAPDALTDVELANLLDALRQLAVVKMKQGDYPAAERFITRALELSRVRVAAAPNEVLWHRELCRSLASFGQWQGERELGAATLIATFEASLGACESALKLKPNDTDLRFETAAAHGNVAMARLLGADLAAAERSFIASNAVLSELRARAPNEQRYLEQLASNFAWLSQLLETDYRAADALAARQSNLHLLDELAELAPDSQVWREDRAIALNRLGQLKVAMGQRADADVAFSDAQQLIDAQLKIDPANRWTQRLRAIVASRRAQLAPASSASLAAADAAAKALGGLKARDQDSADLRRLHAQAELRAMAIALALNVDDAALLGRLERAQAELLAASAEDVESRLWAAQAMRLSAQKLRRNGDVDGAQLKLNQALQTLELIPGDRLSWESDALRADLLDELKRREEALSVRQRLKARGFNPL